jgi:hypothetical protein
LQFSEQQQRQRSAAPQAVDAQKFSEAVGLCMQELAAQAAAVNIVPVLLNSTYGASMQAAAQASYQRVEIAQLVHLAVAQLCSWILASKHDAGPLSE